MLSGLIKDDICIKLSLKSLFNENIVKNGTVAENRIKCVLFNSG